MKKCNAYEDGRWDETETGTQEGPYKMYYENGVLEEIGSYIGGIKQGPYEMYNKKCEMTQAGTYKDNYRHGDFTSYYESGVIKERGNFKMGEIDGILEQFDNKGKLVNQYFIRDGESKCDCVSYNFDAEKIEIYSVVKTSSLCFERGKKTDEGDMNTLFPSSLSYYVYDVLKGICYVQGDRYDPNTITLKEYLGTYFPRTFMEAQAIFSELLKNTDIEALLKNLPMIRILDIGCGVGAGFALGLIWTLNRYGINKNIECHLIDPRSEYLDSAKEMMTLFAKNVKISTFCMKINQDGSFSAENLKELEQTYNIITSSKMCVELYDSGKDNIFINLIGYIDKTLDKNGIGVLNDVTRKDITVNGEFISKRLAKETNDYIQSKNGKLELIMPMSCAFNAKNCKKWESCFQQNEIEFRDNKNGTHQAGHCFRIFVSKENAAIILKKQNMRPTYQTTYYGSDRKKGNKYCDSTMVDHLGNVKKVLSTDTKCYNAFKFDNKDSGDIDEK